EAKIFRASLRIETPRHCDRLQQCRFARAVFAHKKSNLGMKLQPVQMINRRQGKRIAIEGRHVLSAEAELGYVLTRNHIIWRLRSSAGRSRSVRFRLISLCV